MNPSQALGATIAVVDGVSRRVTVGRTTTQLLAPTSLTLRAGTLVALSGPSGSGKTTLCNILLGWDPPDTGTVRWVSPATGWERTSVAPQRLALLEALSVRENLLLPAWAAGRDVDADALAELAERLHLVGLLDRRPSELSFGEQQRAAIARAVVGAPAAVVLDEPTGHQDEVRARAVVDALLATRERGACVVVATHDEDVIAAADEVIALRGALSAEH
jgi:putative ABC transport system ATP-binding protein